MSEERERLKAEVEALKAAREAKEAATKHAAAEAERAAAAEARRFSPGRLRASVVRQPPFGWFLLGSAAFVSALAPLDRDLSEPPVALFGVTAGCLLAMAVMLAWRFGAPSRHRAWLSSLPFRLEGFTELLGGGRAVTEVRVELRFKDTPAPVEILEELLRVRLPQGEDDPKPTLRRTEHGTFLECTLSREADNRVLFALVTALGTRVLRDVHGGYPLEVVRVEATRLDPFWEPSPD